MPQYIMELVSERFSHTIHAYTSWNHIFTYCKARSFTRKLI